MFTYDSPGDGDPMGQNDKNWTAYCLLCKKKLINNVDKKTADKYAHNHNKISNIGEYHKIVVTQAGMEYMERENKRAYKSMSIEDELDRKIRRITAMNKEIEALKKFRKAIDDALAE